MYVNDILLTESDSDGLVEIKEYLRRYFMTKDMSKLKYFLEIEVTQHRILLSQRKYALNFF